MPLSDTERSRVVSYLRETGSQVLDETAGLTVEQWRFRPLEGAWSASDCVEHLTLIEEGLLRTVQAMANQPEAPADVLAQTAGRDDMIVRMIRSRKQRVEAPPSVRPSCEPGDPLPMLERFRRVRQGSIEYLESTSDPLRARVYPHYILGPFDGYQWMLFLAAHVERHLKQVREAKDHPDFPRSAPVSSDGH